jgi:hypothetical protein
MPDVLLLGVIVVVLLKLILPPSLAVASAGPGNVTVAIEGTVMTPPVPA